MAIETSRRNFLHVPPPPKKCNRVRAFQKKKWCWPDLFGSEGQERDTPPPPLSDLFFGPVFLLPTLPLVVGTLLEKEPSPKLTCHDSKKQTLLLFAPSFDGKLKSIAKNKSRITCGSQTTKPPPKKGPLKSAKPNNGGEN